MHLHQVKKVLKGSFKSLLNAIRVSLQTLALAYTHVYLLNNMSNSQICMQKN